MSKTAKINIQIGERLRQFGEQRYPTLVDFAEALGISSESLHQYLAGKSKPGNKLQTRLRSVGCDIEWLMTGSGEPPEIPMSGWAPFRGRVYANPDGKEYFDTDNIPEDAGLPSPIGNFFCLEIDNDSLINAEPIPIYPGDLCIFEHNRQPKNGDIVAVQFFNGRRTIKIFKHRDKDTALLISANKFRNYPSKEIKKSDIKSFGIFVERRQMTDEQKRRYGIK
jgi:SOS-response transcriptional repressor LexA